MEEQKSGMSKKAAIAAMAITSVAAVECPPEYKVGGIVLLAIMAILSQWSLDWKKGVKNEG